LEQHYTDNFTFQISDRGFIIVQDWEKIKNGKRENNFLEPLTRSTSKFFIALALTLNFIFLQAICVSISHHLFRAPSTFSIHKNCLGELLILPPL
jgi:hypothetical protein